ncbi:hypothetical protein [Rhodococcus jostii]|uniref:ATP-dependent Clp protease ATP-binding subunit ClpC n=1 Tax=Rhodococcus jostii TaxID=132919 RepID=A0A1H4J7J2_RHOJO|nr:hypothetical protein [Rhodococcus jostii]SEB42223.1 ATP-dependent Clp protease ATP-binding subunit ClpC [Rhodococcus jostii]
MVFERFSDQARSGGRSSPPAAPPAPTMLVGIFDAGGPGAAALTS